MPEGPEVETIRRGLEMSIVGQTVAKGNVAWERSWAAAPEMASQIVAGGKVLHGSRRGQVVLDQLEKGYSLYFPREVHVRGWALVVERRRPRGRRRADPHGPTGPRYAVEVRLPSRCIDGCQVARATR